VSTDGYDGGLITRDQQDELDAAVRTLAEFLYECGFPTKRALDVAWVIAQLPEFMRTVEEDPW